MQEVFCCFGEKKVVENRLYTIKPDLKVKVVNNCLDNTVYLENIKESDYYDILKEMDDIIYNDNGISLEETFVNFLSDNNLLVAVSESCTGGMLSASIINVSGASKVFYEGIVTYNNQFKINRLGVSKDTLKEWGAVSEETAKEMAWGLLNNEVDLAISTTGIAGPDGGTVDKPVGLVYIGIASTRKETFAIKNNFEGTREQIRRSAKNASLFYALRFLKENHIKISE